MVYRDPAAEEYRFGQFRLLPRLGRLLRGDKIVLLPGRATRLLTLLVEHHDRIVSRDEIFADVWSGVIVGDAALWKQIRLLRIAIGDDAVKTLPGYGYRFGMTVEYTRGSPPADVVAELPSSLRQLGRIVQTIADDNYCITVPEVRHGEADTLCLVLPSGGPDAPDKQRKTNLPVYLDQFIGRQSELAELASCMAGNRLVTIVGPGGVGKTRLAIAAADGVEQDFPDGVWLVDLAPLAEAAQVAGAAAVVLGVAVAGAQSPAKSIAAAIKRRQMLLVFDNCEYLVDAAAALIRTIRAEAPRISILATSQTMLGIEGEQIWRLQPLALPPPRAATVAGFSAVDLFAARAASSSRHFRLSDDNGETVAAICRMLDGIPLALEMAAARIRHFGIEELRVRLQAGPEALRSMPGLPSSRYDKLAAVIEWSHGLLSETDQRLFRRLAIFPGSFSLEAAAAVIGLEGQDASVIEDHLSRLIDKSIATIDSSEGLRYRLYEPLRRYAERELEVSGESDRLSLRLIQYLIQFFTKRYRQFDLSILSSEWCKLCAPELENIRRSMDWAFAAPERSSFVLSFAPLAGMVWINFGLFLEARGYFDRAATLLENDTWGMTSAWLLYFAGVAWSTSDHPRALSYWERAVAISRQVEDLVMLCTVLPVVARTKLELGRPEEAKLMLPELELLVEIGNKQVVGWIHYNLSQIYIWLNEMGKAKSHINELLNIFDGPADTLFGDLIGATVASYEFFSGDGRRASCRMKEIVARARNRGAQWAPSIYLLYLATYQLLSEESADARSNLEEALPLLCALGGHVVRSCLLCWVLIGSHEGRYPEAARVLGYVTGSSDHCGEGLEFTNHLLYCRIAKLIGEHLTKAEFEELSTDGSTWGETRAVNYVATHLIPQPVSH